MCRPQDTHDVPDGFWSSVEAIVDAAGRAVCDDQVGYLVHLDATDVEVLRAAITPVPDPAPASRATELVERVQRLARRRH